MGCGMVPMMFPGIQQYMPAMGMGVGMSMGMEMGMNRPVMPFPNMLPGSALPAAAHLGPRFPMPPFHMPRVPATNSSRMQAENQSDNHMVAAGPPDPNQSRLPNFTDPYQQYLGPHPMQFQVIQVFCPLLLFQIWIFLNDVWSNLLHVRSIRFPATGTNYFTLVHLVVPILEIAPIMLWFCVKNYVLCSS